MRVSTVVFDWYATLAAPHPDDVWTAFPQLIEAWGGHPDAETIAGWKRDHPLRHSEQSVSEKGYRSWQRERLGNLAAACGLHGESRKTFLDHIDELRYTRLFDVFADVRPVLIALKARGVTVGVCSNWDWCLDRHLLHNGIGDLLDAVVCSAIVGVRKPDPAIFDLVVDQTGADPGATLFVGDSWHDDVVGALTAGLTPVHLVRAGDCPTLDHGAVACVTGLNEVLHLCSGSQ